jgi:hypothetical protein
MAKVLKTAALVVGVIALAATGIGAVLGAVGAATFLGLTAATFTSIGAIAAATSAVRGLPAAGARRAA